MSKSRFSARAFMEQNKVILAGDAGKFPTINSGVYDVTIQKSFYKIHDSGSESVQLSFQISEEDEDYPNQIVFWSQTLVNKDGNPNEIGCQRTIVMLLALSEGQFDANEFEVDLDASLEKFLLTECRIKLQTEKVGKYTDNKVEIISVARNRYSGTMALPKKEEPDIDEADEAFEVEGDIAPEDENTQEVEIGQEVQYRTKEGETLATVENFIESADGGEDMLMLKLPNGKLVAAKQEDCNFLKDITDEEEEEEEEIEKDLEVGMTVSSSFNGESFTGKIHSIDENTGIVKIIFNKKIRKCKIENTVAQ